MRYFGTTIALAILCSPSFRLLAQDGSVPADPDETFGEAAIIGDEDKWTLSFAPYLWLPGFEGDVGVGPVQASVDRLGERRRAGTPYEVVVFDGADHNLRMVDGGKEAPFEDRIAEWLQTRPQDSGSSISSR